MTELQYWTNQIKEGRISRREFMGRAAALGVTTALATTMLSQAGIGAEPKKGGSAKFGLAHGATTDTMDPGNYLDTGTSVPFWGAMSNSLTEVDAKGNIVGDLAETMEPSSDTKQWVFSLRKGLTFHNGKDVTANDVVASFRHHMGKDSKSAAKSLLESVSDIKADGKERAVFTLAGPNADFPYLVSDYHIPIMPAKEDGTADWDSKVRTGAFVFESWEPGIRAKLKRNPNYHKSGMPHFDDVEFLSITDVVARNNALISGEVHWIGRPDLKTLSLLKRNPEVAITEVTGYGHYVFAMNVTTPPFNNVDVRTALKWAINREDIAKKVFLGHAAPGNDNPIAPTVKYAIDPQPKYVYDPEKAKFHLKKAGLSTLKVDLSAADAAFNGCVDAAVLYREHAKAAGIEINVVREPNDGYWDNVWLKKPWCAGYWNGRPTIDWMVTTVYAKGAAWNETHWDNARFNELLVAARGETDDKKRVSMYAEIQQLIHDDGGVIVLVFYNYVEAATKKLAHGDIAPSYPADGLKIAERWWFA
jgi:peptide/nickel transport system substrate-binding protein